MCFELADGVSRPKLPIRGACKFVVCGTKWWSARAGLLSSGNARVAEDEEVGPSLSACGYGSGGGARCARVGAGAFGESHCEVEDRPAWWKKRLPVAGSILASQPAGNSSDGPRRSGKRLDAQHEVGIGRKQRRRRR